MIDLLIDAEIFYIVINFNYVKICISCISGCNKLNQMFFPVFAPFYHYYSNCRSMPRKYIYSQVQVTKPMCVKNIMY